MLKMFDVLSMGLERLRFLLLYLLCNMVNHPESHLLHPLKLSETNIGGWTSSVLVMVSLLGPCWFGGVY